MAAVKFERVSAPTGSVTFSVNPDDKGYNPKTVIMQPKEFSESGDLYCYGKGINKNYKTLQWSKLPSADFENYKTFITAIDGAANSFTFTDYTGSTYTARVMNADNVEGPFVQDGYQSLVVELLIEAAL